MEVVARPVRPNFLSVTSVVILFICCSTFHSGWTLPQISMLSDRMSIVSAIMGTDDGHPVRKHALPKPNEQYQANIYIPQAPTDFSHPSESGRDFSPPAAAVNQVPVQEDPNERPAYDNQPNEEDFINERPRGRPYAGSFAEELDGATGEDSEKSIPGSPEQDYPVFEEIPRTSFSCHDKPVPAYYADVEARCQVFHICDVGGHKHSFLCPNGSVFNQKYLVCDWWYDFACENAENLFSKQLLPAETTTPFTPDVNNAAQTFSHDGALIYQPPPQNGDFNLNPVYNPGLPQTQLDTQQQVYTNNYYVPQNDIFHGAETGFPGRDLIHANLDNVQPTSNDAGNNSNGDHNNYENNNNTSNRNLNNESYNNGNNNYYNNGNNHNNGNPNNGNFNNRDLNNGNLNNGNPSNGNPSNGNLNNGDLNNGNLNNGNPRNVSPNNGNLNNGDLNNGNFNNGNLNNGNYNNVNFNSTNNFNNQNVNKPIEDHHNVENRNINKGDNGRSYIEKQPAKLNHESGDNRNHNIFQNKRDEPNITRKLLKGVRRGHGNSKLTTTQSSSNFNTKVDEPQVFQEQSTTVNYPAAKVNPEQVSRNVVNDTVGLQRNENNYNNNDQLYGTDVNNANGFNANNFQTNVNNNFNTPNTQFQPPNTYREADSFQTNQYTRPDAIQ